ncbi:hypothetical protein QBC39DRAFT_15014 [Podospora conica]|nr:hypothetical protein QBC39DRAFT_15014 [Schizothecium conicum]
MTWRGGTESGRKRWICWLACWFGISFRRLTCRQAPFLPCCSPPPPLTPRELPRTAACFEARKPIPGDVDSSPCLLRRPRPVPHDLRRRPPILVAVPILVADPERRPEVFVRADSPVLDPWLQTAALDPQIFGVDPCVPPPSSDNPVQSPQAPPRSSVLSSAPRPAYETLGDEPSQAHITITHLGGHASETPPRLRRRTIQQPSQLVTEPGGSLQSSPPLTLSPGCNSGIYNSALMRRQCARVCSSCFGHCCLVFIHLSLFYHVSLSVICTIDSFSLAPGSLGGWSVCLRKNFNHFHPPSSTSTMDAPSSPPPRSNPSAAGWPAELNAQRHCHKAPKQPQVLLFVPLQRVASWRHTSPGRWFTPPTRIKRPLVVIPCHVRRSCTT